MPRSPAEAVYAGVVVTVAAGWLLLAATTKPFADPTEFIRFPDGWRPPASMFCFWGLGLLSLVAAARCPVVSLVILLIFAAGIPRYSLLYQFQLQLCFLECVAALGTLATLVDAETRRRWRSLLEERQPLVMTVLLGALLLWITVSAATAALVEPHFPPARTTHPLRFLSAAGAFAIAAVGLRLPRDLAWLGPTVAVSLAVRVIVFRETATTNGDLAQWGVVSLPLVGILVWTTRTWTVRLAAVLMASGLLGLLVVTQNRGAMLALVALLVALPILSRRRIRAILAVLAVLSAGGLVLGLSDYGQRFRWIQDRVLPASGSERLEIWKAGWAMSREHPMLGVGPGNFPNRIGEYNRSLSRYGAHNNLLAMLADAGWPGLLFYTVLMLKALSAAARVAIGRAPPWDQVGRGVALAFVAYLVSGVFVARPSQPLPFLLVGALVPLATSLRSPPVSAPRSSGLYRMVRHDSPAAPRRWRLLLAALGYTAFTIYGSLVPVTFRPLSFAEAVDRFQRIPFLELGVGHRADWVANILLFIPLSFLWCGVFSVDRSRRRAWLVALLLIPVWAAFSTAIEFTQLWFPPRTVSQNDIYAETLGGILGGGLWVLAGQAFVDWLRGQFGQRTRSDPWDWILQAYVLGFVIYNLIPFDLTISLTEIVRKWEAGRIRPVPFTYVYGSGFEAIYQLTFNILQYIPIGAWTASFGVPRDSRVRPLWAATLWGGLVALAVEVAQIFVYSRYSDATGVLMGTIGAAVGAALMRRYRGEGAQRQCTVMPCADRRARWRAIGLLALAAGYAAFLALGFWYPYTFTSDRQLILARWDAFFAVPLSRLYFGTEFNAIRQVVLRIVLFVPLGVLLAASVRMLAGSSQPAGRVLLVLAAAAILSWAAVIEAVQVVIPSKTADSTEILFAFVGGLAGMWVSLRALPADHARRA